MKTFDEMTSGLIIAGGVQEQARLSGKSLTVPDRDYIIEAKIIAKSFGLSESMIQSFLTEGAENVKRRMPA